MRTKEDGIAVEFLEYLAPRDGKAFPKDTKSSDLWHWQTSFETEQMNLLADVLSKNKYDFISSGAINFSGNNFDSKRALMVRDADGHAARIIQR